MTLLEIIKIKKIFYGLCRAEPTQLQNTVLYHYTA